MSLLAHSVKNQLVEQTLPRLGLQVRVFTSHTNESSPQQFFPGHSHLSFADSWLIQKISNPSTQTPASRFWGLEVYYLTQSWKTLGQNLDTYRHISFPSLSLLWYFNGANGTIQSNSQSRRCQEQKDQHGNHGERTSTVDCTDSEIVGENSWLVGASSLLIERATATEQINTQASSLEDLLINYIPVYFSWWLKSNALTKQMRTTFWTAQKRWNVWLTLLKIWDQKMKQTRWNVTRFKSVNPWCVSRDAKPAFFCASSARWKAIGHWIVAWSHQDLIYKHFPWLPSSTHFCKW